MLGETRSGQFRDLPVREAPLDDAELVRGRLADADHYVLAVVIDRHVAVTRPVILEPVLHCGTLVGEHVALVARGGVLKDEHVAARRGYRDIAVLAGKRAELDVGELDATFQVDREGDLTTGGVLAPDRDV